MSDRSIVAGNVSRSVIVTGDGNRVSLVLGDSGIVLPLVRRQVPAPDRRRKLGPGEARRELDVLVPDHRAAPLVGRDDLLDDLVGWLEEDVDISVRALTGRAGSGKTRLAIELCARVDGAPVVGDWTAGFLPPAELPTAVETLAMRDFDWQHPTLLVIDYAAQVQAALVRWLDRLVKQGPLTGKLRFLLLEREAPEGFGWWKELTAPRSNAGAQRTDLFWDANLRPVELPGLVGLEDRRQVMAATLAAAVALRGIAVPAEAIPEAGADAGFDATLAEPRFGNPLSIMMAGVLALDRPPPEALGLRQLEAARRLAARELRRLCALAEAGSAAAMDHLAAFNGLAGGLPIAGLREALTAELAAAGLAGHAAGIATLLQQELPAPEEANGQAEPRLGTVQPDLVGEGLILEALSGEPAVEVAAPTLVARAYALTQERAARALMQLLQDYAYALEDATATGPEKATARQVMGWLTHPADSIDDPEALEPLAYALPRETLVLREEALRLTERLAEAFRAAHQATGTPEAATRAAGWLSNLGVRLSNLGRREAALAAAQEAVDLRRGLAAARPDAFTPDLAMSLNNLGTVLSALGRREAALAAAQEAMDLRRGLAAARPDAFTPDLAMSLSNLGNRLSALGQREAALAAAQEAVDLYRRLAAARPDAFTPDLAASLNNFGNVLSDLGQREAALAAAQEAVNHYRGLAAARPDAFTPNLAASLNNLGIRLSDLGQREAALAAAQEAVDLYRGLAAARPDAFRVDLSVSLGALADAHRAAGNPRAARDALTEAMLLLRPVFLQVPQAAAQWMQMHLERYFALGEELGLEPDAELVGPINETLQRLQSGGGDDGQ